MSVSRTSTWRGAKGDVVGMGRVAVGSRAGQAAVETGTGRRLWVVTAGSLQAARNRQPRRAMRLARAALAAQPCRRTFKLPIGCPGASGACTQRALSSRPTYLFVLGQLPGPELGEGHAGGLACGELQPVKTGCVQTESETADSTWPRQADRRRAGGASGRAMHELAACRPGAAPLQAG